MAWALDALAALGTLLLGFGLMALLIALFLRPDLEPHSGDEVAPRGPLHRIRLVLRRDATKRIAAQPAQQLGSLFGRFRKRSAEDR